MKSQRPDKRGHWPRGKRRHAVDPQRHQTAILRLSALLDAHSGRRDGVSRLGLARYVGVSDRTVRRWLSQEDLPSPQALRKIERWLHRHSRRR